MWSYLRILQGDTIEVKNITAVASPIFNKNPSHQKTEPLQHNKIIPETPPPPPHPTPPSRPPTELPPNKKNTFFQPKKSKEKNQITAPVIP